MRIYMPDMVPLWIGWSQILCPPWNISIDLKWQCADCVRVLGLSWCENFWYESSRVLVKKNVYTRIYGRYKGADLGWANEWWWLMRFRTVISHLFVFGPFSFFYIKWVVNFMTLDVRHLKYNKMILVGNYACWLRLRVSICVQWLTIWVPKALAPIPIILFTSMTYTYIYYTFTNSVNFISLARCTITRMPSIFDRCVRYTSARFRV